MSDFKKIAERMRADWDRRIGHDYRFWMSDGYKDDEAMWRSGERDFEILAAGIEAPAEKSLLEVGCGVGRLLRAAANIFGTVCGVDVSSEAVKKAQEFLGEIPNIRVLQGNGIDLSDFSDASFDVVVSFAAITSVPTEIIANYLREMHRVLKPGGIIRLQCYLGDSQYVQSNDTLHLRCFNRDDFEGAVKKAGFSFESVQELVLPFQVSYQELGIGAVVVSLRKESQQPASAEEISETLLPGGEKAGEEAAAGNDLEYWMTVNYARELVEAGDIEHARQTLEYALAFSKNTSIDVRDLLDRIISEINKKGDSKEATQHVSAIQPSAQQSVGEIEVVATAVENPEIFERNRKALSDRFPQVCKDVESWLEKNEPDYCVRTESTAEGAVIFYDGQCLDHPTRPRFAAKKWASGIARQVEQSLEQQEPIQHVCVFGFSGGYHIEEFLNISNCVTSAIEPSVATFVAAMQSHDLVALFTRLEHISIGSGEVPNWFDVRTHLVVRPQAQAAHNAYCGVVRERFYGERGLATLHPRIAVLGPMMGGTLPIMEYTTRSLVGLGQRTMQYDMSGFAGGFNEMEKFVQDDIRKALLRGNYTEMLSNTILESIDEKPIDILICMAQCPISGTVLSELRKRGVITVLWFVEDYLRFKYWQPMSQFYDFIFTIQRGDCLKYIKAAGAGHVHYLPTACDPGIHAPVDVPEEEQERWGSPVSFVGAGYHNRQQMFAALASLPFKIWGTEWPECFPFNNLVQEKGRRLKPEEYVKIFNCTDVNINLHSSTERDGVDPHGDFLNPRTFELAAAGAFQLVDTREYLSEAFEPGKEVVTFDNASELKEKIDYYLNHPEERQEVTDAARKRVLEEHTYLHRIREMLSVIYSYKYEHLKRRQDSSPWIKLLHRAKPHDELYARCDTAYKRGEDAQLDGLVADIVTGDGKLSDTEMKLLFLFHLRKQITRMRTEEAGGKA